MLFHKKEKQKIDPPQRQENNKSLGDQGEAMAASYLESLGFTILRRNYRTVYGEIDIIARQDDVTYFVEVKSRKYVGIIPPSASIDARKKEQIARTALAWFEEQGQETGSTLLIAEVHLTTGDVLIYEDFLR